MGEIPVGVAFDALGLIGAGLAAFGAARGHGEIGIGKVTVCDRKSMAIREPKNPREKIRASMSSFVTS